MRPTKLRLEGIGPHVDTTIEWASLASPAAVVAEYGTGKTFLIEGVIACLFGEFAWYSGSIYDALTQGGDGKGALTLDFEHAGQSYRATRTIRDTGKTRTQKALLENPSTAEVLAGPKVGDFEATIATLIGGKETALATWFLSQNRHGDLCGQPGEVELVARRRAVFNDLIGAAHLDALGERCAVESRRGTTVAEELEAQIAGELAVEQELDVARESMPDSAYDVTAAETCQIQTENRLEMARATLRDAEGDDERLKAQIAQHETAVKALETAQKALDKARENAKALEAKANGKAKAESDLADLARLSEERKTLAGDLNVWEAYHQWKHDLANLEQVEMYERKRVDDLMALPGASDEDRALAARLEELRARYASAKAANEQAEKENVWRRDVRGRLERDAHSTERQIAGLKGRLEKRPETPFGEKCEPCPFLAEYRDLPAEIDRQMAAATALHAELSDVPSDEPLADLAEIRVEGERAAAADKSIQDAAETLEKLADANRKHQDADAAVTVHRGKQPCEGEPRDPREQIEAVNRAVEALAGAQQRLEYAIEAEERLKDWEHERDVADQQAEEATEAVARLAPAADSARATLADRESQRANTREAVRAAEAARNEAQARLKGAAQELANVTARIAELERRVTATAEKRERVSGLRSNIAALADLRTCFGPKGVRQILIDAAAPELEAIADNLFERATGGRMRLRIATQRANQDGSTAEDFAILVRDERGERDALRYSGGQLQLIQILFRIAVAIWVGKIRGHKPDSLFLDEAFDRLGAEGAEDLIRVLEYLRERFGCIVVVTHDRLLADRMPAQVRLEKTFGQVSVETAGQAVA